MRFFVGAVMCAAVLSCSSPAEPADSYGGTWTIAGYSDGLEPSTMVLVPVGTNVYGRGYAPGVDRRMRVDVSGYVTPSWVFLIFSYPSMGNGPGSMVGEFVGTLDGYGGLIGEVTYVSNGQPPGPMLRLSYHR